SILPNFGFIDFTSQAENDLKLTWPLLKNSETQLQPPDHGEGDPVVNRHRSSSTSQRIRSSFHLHRHREPENNVVDDLPPPPPPVIGGPAAVNAEAAW